MSPVGKPVAPRQLAHLVFRTGRHSEMVQWWKTVLVAEAVYENDFIAFLSYDEEHHRVAILNTGTDQDPLAEAAGFEHVAFSYAGVEDLVSTYERLAAAGIEPYWCINHGMTLSMYYRDPDGNQVELQIDRCSAEDAVSFMDSDEFAANPIGVEYDVAEMVAQYRAGGEVDALSGYGPTLDLANH